MRCSQQSSTLSVVCLASRIEALTKIPFAGHPIRPTLSINLYSQGEVYKDAIRRAKLIRRVEVENIYVCTKCTKIIHYHAALSSPQDLIEPKLLERRSSRDHKRLPSENLGGGGEG